MLFKRKPDRAPEVPLAIAHDYLTQRGGAERVVLAMHKAFPQAPIYTTLYNPETTYPEFKDCTIIVSPLNRVGLFKKDHRLALPLLPFFVSRQAIHAQKVLVSSTGWAHGFKLPEKTLVYCHSPARWIYLTDQYLGKNPHQLVATLFKLMRPFLKVWDQKAAQKNRNYLANSTTIQKRIFDVYQKDSEILFPPYSVDPAGRQEPIAGLEEFLSDRYFIIVSRLLPYKNVQYAVEAFSRTDKKLLVVGSGPILDELKASATSNVAFASNISDAQMRYAYAHAYGALAVSHEDFGITPLEAGAFGKPIIALKAGGFLDTIVEGLNGTFISEPSAQAILEAVENFDQGKFSQEAITEHIKKFGEDRFIQALQDRIDVL
ncbi:MAG: glycosyltransferase [Rothia sp. (in: high G+C Gram-positive bacteria)]|nr:glycosyltransferase [Rothia sp. (in: high G+C Gram-positive bacteria)]